MVSRPASHAVGHTTHDTKESSFFIVSVMNKAKIPWRKILYEKQPYADNHIDHTKFLDQLNTSTADQQPVSHVQLMINASAIAQQLTVVATFFTIYLLIVARPERISMRQLLLVDFVSLIIGTFVNTFLDDSDRKSTVLESIRLIFIFAVCLRVSAPVLQTLTSSFSDDTIHALALMLAAAHLIFYDYSFIHREESTYVSSALSLNAAMLTAVLLASRLQDIEMVVAFVLLAVICFSLFPTTARLVKRFSISYHLVLTILQWLLAGSLLANLDLTLFALYEFIVIFLWLVCPLWLKHMHAFKKSLKGPWDEATLNHIDQ